MSTTPVSNILSPDQNAKELEQSNEVRKRVKIFRHCLFFQVLIHYTYISISSLKLIFLNLQKKTLQSKEVRRKR